MHNSNSIQIGFLNAGVPLHQDLQTYSLTSESGFLNVQRITAATLLIAVFLHFSSFDYLILIPSFIFAILCGFYYGLKVSFLIDEKHDSKPKRFEPNEKILRYLQNERKVESESTTRTQIIFTKNVDSTISEIMDLTIRDCVLSWYEDLVYDTIEFQLALKAELWVIISSIKARLENVDEVTYLTENVINSISAHFNKLQSVLSGDLKTFKLSSHLSSESKELHYLQNLSEFLLIILLPKKYSNSLPIRQLIREILTHSVLYPCIDMLCDPDYINQKLLDYLEHQAHMLEEHHRTYAYAASYEDFIQIISNCSSVEDLKQMRYKIMTEIMHSTTINNLKKAKGMGADKQFHPQGTGKADLLEARHLPRYINQLTFCKASCEKRIKTLGGPDYSSPLDDEGSADVEQTQNIPGKKVLSLPVILDNAHARRYLILFLKQRDCQSLLQFWCDVNEMRNAERSKLHSQGNEVFRTYINNPKSIICLSKGIVKGMEAFLIADKGPDSFFDAQDEIYAHIEKKMYPAFIVSDIYHKMITDADESGIDFLKRQKARTVSDAVDGPNEIFSDQILFSDHSSYAKDKLHQISDKLTDKINALDAVSMNLKTDQKVQIIQKLVSEIENLKQEQKNLSLHIERTEVWSENLGHWAATIHTVQEILEDEKLVPYFVIVIHLDNAPSNVSLDLKGSDKWIVSRKISEFHMLYSKLIPSVMENDQLNKSEALYTFLSPSPEYLKTVQTSSHKSKFSLANIFQRNCSNDEQIENTDDDEFLFFDDFDSKDDKKDSKAEPLYRLIGEIFELHGVFKWLRKTMIVFVQISFGSTINKQLRETVSWMLSESMLMYYLNTFKDSMWPEGKMAPAWPIRSDLEKQQTRMQAKSQFLNSIPGFLVNLVGQQNAKQGAIKVFETLQDKQLNKQLLYNIIEDFMEEFSPELNEAEEAVSNSFM
ncbi:Sorting nexin-25 [Nymphon striatum]|nr:Sorting nexin-25 [Nymphon striatum]